MATPGAKARPRLLGQSSEAFQVAFCMWQANATVRFAPEDPKASSENTAVRLGAAKHAKAMESRCALRDFETERGGFDVFFLFLFACLGE